MKAWVGEHSLSLVLGVIMAVTLVRSLMVGANGADIWSNLFGDTWGAFLIVVTTKYGRERGSAESK